MNLIPRILGDKHEWAIIGNTNPHDCILISLIDSAALLDNTDKAVALFKKGTIVAKQGENYTYNNSDLTRSTKSNQ